MSSEKMRPRPYKTAETNKLLPRKARRASCVRVLALKPSRLSCSGADPSASALIGHPLGSALLPLLCILVTRPWPASSPLLWPCQLVLLPSSAACFFYLPCLLWAWAPFPTRHRQLAAALLRYMVAQPLLNHSDFRHFGLLYKKDLFRCSEALERQDGRTVKRAWTPDFAWFWILGPLHTNSWASYPVCASVSSTVK